MPQCVFTDCQRKLVANNDDQFRRYLNECSDHCLVLHSTRDRTEWLVVPEELMEQIEGYTHGK